MFLSRSKVVSCALVIVVGLIPALSPIEANADGINSSGDVSAGHIAFDGLVVRPLILAGTVLGAAIFVATLPFSIPAGGVSVAGRKLVAEPAAYTFTRPFGEFGPDR